MSSHGHFKTDARLDDVVRKVLRVRRREADPKLRIDGRHPVQQLGEAAPGPPRLVNTAEALHPAKSYDFGPRLDCMERQTSRRCPLPFHAFYAWHHRTQDFAATNPCYGASWASKGVLDCSV